MDPPFSNTQSLHQRLIVQCSKPVLTYTRVTEYHLTSSHYSILSLDLSISLFDARIFPGPTGMNNTAPSHLGHGNYAKHTPRSMRRRFRSSFNLLTTLLPGLIPKRAMSSYDNKRRSFRSVQTTIASSGPNSKPRRGQKSKQRRGQTSSVKG